MNLLKTYTIGILILLFSCKKEQKENYWEEAPLVKDSIYLAFRGTKSKEGFIARNFNIKDSLSSHVGLLLNNKNQWYVYHVLDFEDEQSDLRRHEASLFFNPEKEMINYASIWLISSFDLIEIKCLKERIRFFESKFIKFDRLISLKDSTNLYCSEFIYRLLNHTDPQVFELAPRKIKLKGIYASYFRRDSLEYVPVDIFQLNKEIHSIKEWIFN